MTFYTLLRNGVKLVFFYINKVYDKFGVVCECDVVSVENTY